MTDQQSSAPATRMTDIISSALRCVKRSVSARYRGSPSTSCPRASDFKRVRALRLAQVLPLSSEMHKKISPHRVIDSGQGVAVTKSWSAIAHDDQRGRLVSQIVDTQPQAKIAVKGDGPCQVEVAVAMDVRQRGPHGSG